MSNGDLSGADLDAAQRRHAISRLEILDALAAAIERRSDVCDLVVSSPSADHARARLIDLLGVSESGALAILDLQWRRLAELERTRIMDEREQIRRTLA